MNAVFLLLIHSPFKASLYFCCIVQFEHTILILGHTCDNWRSPEIAEIAWTSPLKFGINTVGLVS